MPSLTSATVEPVFDVFLSYNSADKRVAKQLAERLKKEQIRPWLDQWNLVPGEPWLPEIEKALTRCRSVAVLVGPNGVSSWQREEMQTAVRRRVHETAGLFRLIPVLLPGTMIEAVDNLHFLCATTWVQFNRTLDDMEAFHRLVCGIRGLEPGAEWSREKEGRRRFCFIVDGTVDQIDLTRIQAFVEHLRRYSADATVGFKELRKGSVRILLESTQIGLERLEFLFRTGQLRKLSGMSIHDMVIHEVKRVERAKSVASYDVLIVDAEVIMREGIKSILRSTNEFRVVGESEDGPGAVQYCRKSKPDIILMEIALAGLNGIKTTQEILRHQPDVRVIILSMYDDENAIVSAIRAGARAYILIKKATGADLIDALRTVAKGGTYLSPQVADRLQNRIQRDDLQSKALAAALPGFSLRELEILRLMGEGKTSKEIASLLDLGPQTIRSYRKILMKKLGVTTPAGSSVQFTSAELVHRLKTAQ